MKMSKKVGKTIKDAWTVSFGVGLMGKPGMAKATTGIMATGLLVDVMKDVTKRSRKK